MDVINRNIYLKKIKYILVFFCAILFLNACKDTDTLHNINVHYEQNKAVSVHFTGTSSTSYQIIKKEENAIPVLGELNAEGMDITFTPVIPFTSGISYEIKIGKVVVGEFNIKENTPGTPPKVTAIYPKLDTVPENLLKMYITFSKPMQEVRSALDFISVINLTTQKTEDIFLPLETELWNADHTELTLWLDPGRIKKDLIPNRELGIPIKQGNRYEIVLSTDWSDAKGNALDKEYRKSMVVGARDVQLPSIKNWSLTIPKIASKEALGIAFGESMDAMLIDKDLQIFDANNTVVSGGFLTMGNPSSTLFIPKERWKKGTYTLVVQSSMEDLAGNNLNRLFDTDLQKKKTTTDSKTKTIRFTIQ